jgi:hypothetical protein
MIWDATLALMARVDKKIDRQQGDIHAGTQSCRLRCDFLVHGQFGVRSERRLSH